MLLISYDIFRCFISWWILLQVDEVSSDQKGDLQGEEGESDIDLEEQKRIIASEFIIIII